MSFYIKVESITISRFYIHNTKIKNLEKNLKISKPIGYTAIDTVGTHYTVHICLK